MKKYLLIAALLMSTQSTLSKNYKTTKEAMSDIFMAFVDLIPYTANEMKFKDPKSEEFIKARFLKLKSSFKNARHLKKIKSLGLNPSYQAMTDHLEKTYETLSLGHKSFARNRVRATAMMCISCHTQLPAGTARSFRSYGQVNREVFVNDYEYGDYLFLIRNYTNATHYYRKEIKERIAKNSVLKKEYGNLGSAKFVDFTIEKSLERLLTMSTKVFYRPKKALKELSVQKQIKGMPKGLMNKISTWEEGLRTWVNRNISEFKNDNDVNTFINKYGVERFNHSSSHVDLLISSGVMYRYLNKNANTQIAPKILYSLAKIDEVLNYSYFYSLSELYLKKCITKYSKSPYAKKCFNHYVDKVNFGYTGTSGTNIPKDELKEIERLRSFLSN